MFRRGLALCLAFGFASIASAATNITLVKNPDKATYTPGEAVSVDVMLSQDTGVQRLVRLIQLDVNATDASLLAGATYPMGFWICPGSCDTDHLVEPIPTGDRTNIGAVAYLGLAANAGQQIVLPANESSVMIGQIDLIMPAVGSYTLNVVDGLGDEPDEGAEVRWGFGVLAGDDLTRCRADGVNVNCVGGLTGGIADFVVEDASAGNPLVAQFPTPSTAADQRFVLWRTNKNFVRYTFQNTIAAAPGTGDITIQQMSAGGVLGEDLSGTFNFNVNGSILTVEDQGTTLANRTWYRIRNSGDTWTDGDPFCFFYFTQFGDANNDGVVSAADLANINTSIPTFPAGINDSNRRRDINADNLISAADLGAANAFIPGFPTGMPSGHLGVTCP